MIKYIVMIFILVGVAFCSNAITVDFEGGIPEKWIASSQWKNGTYNGKTYLASNVASVNKDTYGYVKLTESYSGDQLPSCDNVVAEVILSNTRPKNDNVDMFQVVVSTNGNWREQDIVPVGEPFKYYDANVAADWVSHKVVANISELSKCSEFYVGLKVIAAGWSMNTVYVKSLSVDFLAGASVTGVSFKKNPQIGDTSVDIFAVVNTEPRESISDLTVWAEIERNGDVYTNQMFEAENSVYTNNILKIDSSNGNGLNSMPIDAGDTIKVSVFTKYHSSIGAIGFFDEESGYYSEKTAWEVTYTAPKLGSVWINKFSLEQIDFCGTKNRQYMGGWSLELIDANLRVIARTVFDSAFNFSTNMPNCLIGIESHKLGWQLSGFSNPCFLSLRNASGVEEHKTTVFNLTSAENIFGMTGIAPWPESGAEYDWTGTSTNQYFNWNQLDGEFFGVLNKQQFFEIKNKGWFQVNTTVASGDDAEESFEFANVEFFVDWSNGGDGDIASTDSAGLTPVVEFEGTHTNETFVIGEFNVSAFGWYAERIEKPLFLGCTNLIKIPLGPTIAVDSFSTGRLEPYWNNIGGKKFIYEDGRARFDSRMVNAGESNAAIIQSKNFLKSRDKKNASIAFSVRNDLKYGPGVNDYAYVQIATNDEFTTESIIAQTISVSNRVADIETGAWNTVNMIMAIPNSINDSMPIYARVKGVPGGWSQLYLDVDNLRIAFQDMATVEGLRRIGTEKKPSFEIDVEPWCGEGQSVSNVTAQLVMDVNGKVFTNEVAAVNLAEDTTFTISNEIIRANLRANVGYEQLRAHDKVKYWAQVKYFADSRDPDPAKEWETKFYPDNSTKDSEGRWIVEGEYGVDMAKVESENTFIVPGDAITLNGDGIEQTAEGADFSFRVYDASGVGVSNVTVTVTADGREPKVFEFTADEAGIVRFDGNVELRDLVENTEYTITINGTNYNGETIATESFSDSFITWPKPPSAAITSDSKNSATLTVSGSSGRYKVSEGWTSNGDGTTWTKSGLTPNSEVTATVRSINDSGESAPRTVTGYTLAAMATRAPAYEEGMTSATIYVGDDYVAEDDGNPDNTLYAVRVTTERDKTGIIATNGTEEVWQTLADWRNNRLTVSEPTIDLTVTNYFSFVTRNGDGVMSESTVKADCWFDMKAEFDGVPQQIKGGMVKFSLKFFDPANAESATAEVEYKIGDEWVRCGELAVEFNERNASIKYIEWDAWTAVGENSGHYSYGLRVRVNSGNRSSEWTEAGGELDFVAPEGLTLEGSPEANVIIGTKDVNFTAQAEDTANITYRWIFNGTEEVDVTEGSFKATSNEGGNTISVYAEDEFGNTSAPLTRGWTVDTIKPTNLEITGTPANGAKTNNDLVALTATATDATALKYLWKFNGSESEGAALKATAKEGENSASVIAIDAAGNESEPVEWIWELDTTKPEITSFNGNRKEGEITSDKGFNFTVESMDANSVSYVWTLNGVEQSEKGATFIGEVLTDGKYTVAVTAVDVAGNRSDSVSVSWTLDTTKPEITKFEGNRTAGEKTNVKEFSFTVEATDKNTVSYIWKLNGAVQAETGATFAGEVSTDGDYTVTVVAVDAAKNKSDALSLSWELDTTKPEIVKFEGTRTAGEKTNEKAFSFTVEATDKNTVSYIWKLNDVVQSATGATFEGEVSADGDYTVTVVAVDAAKNQSEARSISWELDTTKPEITKFEGNRTAGEKTNVKEFSFTVEATDKNTVSYIWKLNGAVQAETGATFAGEVSTDGDYMVTVVAVDAANNQSEERSLGWELDTTKPEIVKFEGNRTAEEKTNDKEFSFTVEATDKNTISYVWKLNDVEQMETGATFTGEVSADGDYVVSVVAIDAANNQSEERSLSWELDTTKPEIVKFEGNRTAGETTNDKEFGFTVEATDKNTVSYIWKLNDVVQSAIGTTFTGEVSADGDYTVTVVAVDAANNHSEERSLSWTLDTTKPEIVKFEGNRTDGEKTNDKEFSFTVEATDENTVSYIWKLNDAVQSATGTTFTGEVSADGDYTVTVVAVDAAKNKSEERSISWELDTTKPEIVKFEGNRTAGEKTNEKSFSFTVEATDKNMVSYIWKLNDVVQSETGTTFTGEVSADGDYTVTVVAVDAAKNQSEARSISWELDTTKPEIVKFEGTRTEGEKTNDKSFSFTVEATDKNTVSYIWTLNGAVQTVTGATFAGEVAADGDYTVSVVAVDAAKNKSDALSLNWELDTMKPEIVKFEGTRTVGEKTNKKAFSFTVEATDKNTVSYIWKLNDVVQSETGMTFTGEVSTDGDYTVTVLAVDAAKNKSEGRFISWELDTTKPEIVKFEGNRTAGEKTNDKTFSFTVEATDKNTVSYIWKLNDVVQSETGATFTGEVSEDGDYTVTVVAVDAAENESESRFVGWEYDSTKPTVELTCSNEIGEGGKFLCSKLKPMIVTAKFSENVDGFAIEDVSTVNGIVSDLSGSGDTYTFKVTPEKADEVRVNIAADVVVDDAKNENTQSNELVGEFTDDVKPAISLMSEAPERINAAYGSIKVEIRFSEHINGFDTGDIVAGSANVELAVLNENENTYIATITPTKDETMSVVIHAGAVTDDAGNENTESNILTYECDITAPKVELTSSTPEYFNEARNPFAVTVTFSEPVEGFTKDQVIVENGSVADVKTLVEDKEFELSITPNADGEVRVTSADGIVDKFENGVEASSSVARIRDTVKPTQPTITLNKGSSKFLAFASSQDASPVKYYWTVNNSNFTGSPIYIISKTNNKVTCRCEDAAGNKSDDATQSWSTSASTSKGTDFGDDVWMPPSGEYNVPDKITFTASDIKPGSDSKFTFSGVYSVKEDLTALNMYLIVSETLTGPTWKVPVNKSATYNLETGELTVTLPSDEMLDEKGNAYQSFFIHGISNTKR